MKPTLRTLTKELQRLTAEFEDVFWSITSGINGEPLPAETVEKKERLKVIMCSISDCQKKIAHLLGNENSITN